MKKTTGVMIYYYIVCKKRLWYFSNGLNMEGNSELVSIGKIIDENSYKREKKNIMIDNIINIDFLVDWEIIHEIKKSDSLEEASIWQIKYYIYYLNEKGVDIKSGILDYHKLRKRKEIYLEEGDKEKIENMIEDIKTIINLEIPPVEKSKKYCSACSYYELCRI